MRFGMTMLSEICPTSDVTTLEAIVSHGPRLGQFYVARAPCIKPEAHSYIPASAASYTKLVYIDTEFWILGALEERLFACQYVKRQFGRLIAIHELSVNI